MTDITQEEIRKEIIDNVSDCRQGFIPYAIHTYRELIEEFGEEEAIIRAFSSSGGQFNRQELVFIVTTTLLIIAESDYDVVIPVD